MRGVSTSSSLSAATAIALFAWCWFLAPAHAAKRVALVIGNAAYTQGPLANPVNDADAVAEALGGLGFGKVIRANNATKARMEAALAELAAEAAGAEMAVVYFAGHGTERDGRNYLIPIDAKLDRASDLDLQAIALPTVLDQIAGATRLKLVILDACRNNVFPLAGNRRSAARGLARIEPEDNTIVAFAAKDGTVALDSTGGRHSPFTAALLKHIATPGLEVRFLLAEIRDEVVAATQRQQTPHIYGSLGRERLYFAAHQDVAPAALPSLNNPQPPIANATKADGPTTPATFAGTLDTIIAQVKSRSVAPTPAPDLPSSPSDLPHPPEFILPLRKALALTRSLKPDDSIVAVLIGLGLARAGNTDLLPEALSGVGKDLRPSGLAEVALLQVAAGRFDVAGRTLARVEDNHDRAKVLVQLAAKGKHADAVRIALTIKDEDDRESTLDKIGSSQIKRGDILGAMATLRQIRASKNKITVLVDLANHHKQAGRDEDRGKVVQDAVQESRFISDAEDRLGAFDSLARHMDDETFARVSEQAIKLAKSLKNPEDESDWLVHIGARMIERGSVVMGIEILKSAAAASDRSSASVKAAAHIAGTLRGRGYAVEGRLLLNFGHSLLTELMRSEKAPNQPTIQPANKKLVSAAESISLGLVRVQAYSAALAILDWCLKHDAHAFFFYRRAAGVLYRSGERGSAIQFIEHALTKIDSVRSNDRDWALSAFSGDLARFGQIDGALTAVSAIQERGRSIGALTRIAISQAHNGDVLEASARLSNIVAHIERLTGKDLNRALHSFGLALN